MIYTIFTIEHNFHYNVIARKLCFDLWCNFYYDITYNVISIQI